MSTNKIQRFGSRLRLVKVFGKGISIPLRPSKDGTFNQMNRNKCDFIKCHFSQIITIIIRIKINKITKQKNIQK